MHLDPKGALITDFVNNKKKLKPKIPKLIAYLMFKLNANDISNGNYIMKAF